CADILAAGGKMDVLIPIGATVSWPAICACCATPTEVTRKEKLVVAYRSRRMTSVVMQIPCCAECKRASRRPGRLLTLVTLACGVLGAGVGFLVGGRPGPGYGFVFGLMAGFVLGLPVLSAASKRTLGPRHPHGCRALGRYKALGNGIVRVDFWNAEFAKRCNFLPGLGP